MEQTALTSRDLLKIVSNKAKNAINGPRSASTFKVVNNPIKGKDGTYFFNIDAMSTYHVEQAKIACAEKRFSDATRGFTVNVWESDMHLLPSIFKGGEVIVEITEYTNKDGVKALGTKLIKAVEPPKADSVDLSDEFASFLSDEDDLD